MREIVEQVTLPDEWVENMLAEIDREKAHDVSDSRAAVRCLVEEKEEIEAKLGKLLDLHLDGGIERDAYVQKKNVLLNRKIDIEQEIKDSEQKGDDRLEPVRSWCLQVGKPKSISRTRTEQSCQHFSKRSARTGFCKEGRCGGKRKKAGARCASDRVVPIG